MTLLLFIGFLFLLAGAASMFGMAVLAGFMIARGDDEERRAGVIALTMAVAANSLIATLLVKIWPAIFP